MKKLLSVLLSVLLLFSCANLVSADEASNANTAFTDISADDAAGAAINKLVDAGIINGYEDGSFRPNNHLTRAELCKMINLTFGFQDAAEEGFPDVTEDDWYYQYVMVAKKAGYIKGFEDGTFRGNSEVTREQACVMISRIAGLYPLPFTAEITDEVSDWAKEDVIAVLSNHLMELEQGNTFRAKESIKRFEVAVLLAYFVVPDSEISDGGTGSGGTGSGGTGSGGTGSGGTGSGGTGSGGTGSGGTGSGGTGSGGTGSGGTGSGGTGSGGTGSDGTGSGGSGTEDPQDPEPDDTEILEALQDALVQLNAINFTGTGRTIANIVKSCIQNTLNDSDSGITITKDYVKTVYATEIQQAKDLYDDMTASEQADFERKLTNGIDTATAAMLMEYFM